jgi:Protein of unknown function (DUF2971)
MKKQYYKYRPLYVPTKDGKRDVHPFTESIFTKAELYFGAPAEFNDPFDCNLKLHMDDSTDAEWEAYCDDLMVANPSVGAAILPFKNNKGWNNNPAFAADIGNETQLAHYNDSSVLCLAKTGKSIPMFSYYGDSHSGIAIEFSFSDFEVPCGISLAASSGKLYGGKVSCYDVEYPETFPELNYHRLRNTTDGLMRNLIFTKSVEWSHEQEFRIFRRNVPKGLVSFERPLLTGVVFGCKTAEADVELVKKWLNGWPSDVVLSKAEPASDRFELVVHELEVIKGTK